MIPQLIHSWESQARQFPPSWEPGIHLISPEVTVCGRATVVDCLLYYNDENKLVGIWYHYNEGNPLEQAGSCTLFVHPDHYRQGIATALLRRADELWDLKDQDTYTDAGNAWIEGLVAKGKIDPTRTGSMEPNPHSISARKVPHPVKEPTEIL